MAGLSPTAIQPNYIANPTPIDPSQYGANSLMQQIIAAQQPLFQQQQQGLTEGLANAGIVGGSTQGAIGDLAHSQIQTLLGLLAPAQLQAQGQQLNAQEFNTGNNLATQQYNAGTGNSLLSQILGFQNTDWQQQQQDQLALQEGAAGGQTGAFQPVFQQPSPVNFSGLAQSIAPTQAPQQVQAPNANGSNLQWA